MKAIIFARVSTARQEKEGLSLEEIQLPRMRQYAKEQNIEVDKREFVFSETADAKMRKQFDEMVEYVKSKNDIKAIISFRVDRITRNYRDAVAMDELRIDFNKELHFVDDRLVITKNSRSQDITAWDTKVFLAKQTINRLKEDGRNTKYTKLENCELPWQAPYGYRNITIDQRHKSVIPDEFEAEIVKIIFKLYSTGAYSLQGVSKKLKEDHNVKLSKSNALKILRDPFYIGYIYDKETDKDYPHKYEKIISLDLFNEANAVLDNHGKKKFKYAGLPASYRGLIQCYQCHCAITPERKNRKQKDGSTHQHQYYHCTQRKGKHNAEWLTVSELDNQFADIFSKLTIPEKEANRIEQALKESHHDKIKFNEVESTECQNQYDKYQRRIEKAFDMLADGSITQDEYDQNIKRYREEQAKYANKTELLQTADKHYYETAVWILKLARNANRLFLVANEEEKRLLINLVCQNLFLDGKKLIFKLKTPFDSIFGCSLSSQWLPLANLFRNHKLDLSVNLDTLTTTMKILTSSY